MSNIKENNFNLLPHTGKSIYPSSNPDNLINSFCLFNKTISSIFCQKQNFEFSFEKMKKCDKINNEKSKFNSTNNHSLYNLRRKCFLENTFYEDILKNKENFENLHEEENFRMLQNEDKSNSALYYHIKIISNLSESGLLGKTEKNMKEKLSNISEYEKENYTIISDEFICKGMIKNIYYKRVKANGNSFYISFAYQYIKYLVQKGEESLISEIFYIMDKELTKMNNNNVIIEENLGEMYISKSIKNNELNDLRKMFIFFTLIYTNMVNKNIDEAKKMLEYAFKYEESFGNFFTLFMKLQINHFIKINKDIFTYEKYFKNLKLIEEEYYEDGKFLYEKYANNNLFINQMEPSMFIISLVPYVFNVSMNLYIKEKNYSFEKICFDLKENIQTNISILYSNYSYHILDNNLADNNKLKDFDLANTLDLKNSYFQNFNKNDYISIEEKKCNICKNLKLIRFLKKLQNINSSICLNCLKNTIDEILIKRYDKMIAENFKFLEFYLRDIPLTSNEDNEFIFLSPPEFYCLFECNIYTYFRNLILDLCDLCREFKNKIITKECGCKRCLDCAKKEFNFDKNYLNKNDFMICQCRKKINTFKYSRIINDNLDEKGKKDIKEKIEKIKQQLQNYCMYCGTKLNNNNIGSEKFSPIKIKVELNRQLIYHYICLNCKNKKNSSDICIICEQKHEKVEIEENEKSQKKDDTKKKTNYEIKQKKNKKEDIKIIKGNNINIINANNNGKHNNNTSKERAKRDTNKTTTCNGKCIIY